MRDKQCVRLPAYVTGSVNQELLRGESYSEGEASDETAVEQSRARHARRNREAIGA